MDAAAGGQYSIVGTLRPQHVLREYRQASFGSARQRRILHALETTLGLPPPPTAPSSATATSSSTSAIKVVVLTMAVVAIGAVGAFAGSAMFHGDHAAVARPGFADAVLEPIDRPPPPIHREVPAIVPPQGPTDPETATPPPRASPPRRPTPRSKPPRPARPPQVDPMDNPTKRRSSIGEELALIKAARSALRKGKPSAAILSLERHAARFPRGVLADERTVLQAQALCAVGRVAEGRRLADDFERWHSTSALLSRMRRACPDRGTRGG